MIVSDLNKLVFVHIPKCAGTSVRKPLQSLDDREGFFTSRVDQHAELGLLDYVHIPLFTLRDYFGADFEKVRDYWSFGVVRDPFARFPSSISQRFKMYGDQPLQKQGLADIKAELNRSIAFLAKQPRQNHCLPAEYIHFQSQVDYVCIDGEPVVDTLYRVDEVDCLLADVSERVGLDLQAGADEARTNQTNRTVVHRNETLRMLIENSRPVTRLVSRALPQFGRQRLRNMVYVPRDRRFQVLFASDYVKDFIRDYYSDDIDLWNEVLKSRRKGRERQA